MEEPGISPALKKSGFIVGWTFDGEIALSALLPTVETADKQIASGGSSRSMAQPWWLYSSATAHRESPRWLNASADQRNPIGNGSRA